MAAKDYTGIFEPSKTPRRVVPDMLTFLAKDAFTLPQLLLLGALCQIAIFSILPARYALLPTLLLLLHSIVSTTLQATSPARNTFLNGVIKSRTSAVLPEATYSPDPAASSPLFGSRPAASPIVVLHLGVRLNHPLGPLAPGAAEATKHFIACSVELARRASDFGCVGQTTWRAAERASNNTLMTVFYFRDVAGLHAFAHDAVHRAAWDWIGRFARETGHSHIGIFHETFVSAPGGYETIYHNMPPLLLGAANVRVTNEGTGETEFVVPLVDADVPTLRSQYGRMDRMPNGEPVQRS